MAKRGWVLLGAVMFSSGVGCASVVGIQDLPPATDGSGSSSGGGSSSSSSGRSSSRASGSGTVLPSGPCTGDSQCSQSDCFGSPASCIDFGDGQGALCRCQCTWGTDCLSGCCWPAPSGAFYACRGASACSPVGGSCTGDHQCENDSFDCGAFKTYCLDGTCTCGCAFNTDCLSGCCSTLFMGTQSANICDDLFRNCMGS
jgi:hypothetical protein